MGWICFYSRTAQIKHVAVDLICGWCFLGTAIQISSSFSYHHLSKKKETGRGSKGEAPVGWCDPHTCRDGEVCVMALDTSRLTGI